MKDKWKTHVSETAICHPPEMVHLRFIPNMYSFHFIYLYCTKVSFSNCIWGLRKGKQKQLSLVKRWVDPIWCTEWKLEMNCYNSMSRRMSVKEILLVAEMWAEHLVSHFFLKVEMAQIKNIHGLLVWVMAQLVGQRPRSKNFKRLTARKFGEKASV